MQSMHSPIDESPAKADTRKKADVQADLAAALRRLDQTGVKFHIKMASQLASAAPKMSPGM